MEVFGNRIHVEADIYIWGIYCAVGAVCALAAIGIYCASRNMKKGSAPLLGILSILFGAIFSRILFCLFTTFTATKMPFSAWFRFSEGGWTMFGMIGGVLLSAWISARIIREKPARMLDAVSVAVPLLMAAERLGESRLDDLFNYNQYLSSGHLGRGFLTTADEQGTYMIATNRIDAILCLVLFLFLAFSMLSSRRRDGDLWIRFMTFCGAGCVLGESLRTDDFLVYSFVRIEQVLAALLLLGGVIAAGTGAKQNGKKLYSIALITMLLTVAECIGIEFAADRTQARRWLLTGVMTAALSIPVIQVCFLQQMNGDANEGERRKTDKAVWIGLIIAATEVVFIADEMIRIHAGSIFLYIVLAGAALVLAVHAAVLLWANREALRSIHQRKKGN